MPPDDDHPPMAGDRLQAALELLEAIVADRSTLAALPADQRERLLQAVALVHHPEPRARRRQAKAEARERARDKARRTEELLNQTGIRTLRRKPVFTTPNYFPPQAPGQHDPFPSLRIMEMLHQSEIVEVPFDATSHIAGLAYVQGFKVGAPFPSENVHA